MGYKRYGLRGSRWGCHGSTVHVVAVLVATVAGYLRHLILPVAISFNLSLSELGRKDGRSGPYTNSTSTTST